MSSLGIWRIFRAQSLFLTLGALVRSGVNFQAHCRNFRRRVKNFRATASNTWTKKSDLGFVLQYGPILAVLNTTKTNIRIRIFHTELSLDINYSSRFVQYPHYPIASCLPHLTTVAHNRHGKSINLMAKRKISRQKPHGKKNETHSKKNNLIVRQKEKDSRQKEKPCSKRKDSRQKE